MTDIFKKLIRFLLVEYALKYTIPNKLETQLSYT